MVVSLVANVVEMVIPFPLETATPSVVQIAVGELIKPSTVLDTLQVRLYTSPALAVPELLTVTAMALAGTEIYNNNMVYYYNNYKIVI